MRTSELVFPKMDFRYAGPPRELGWQSAMKAVNFCAVHTELSYLMYSLALGRIQNGQERDSGPRPATANAYICNMFVNHAC